MPDHGPDQLDAGKLVFMLRFANAAWTLVTIRKDAPQVMPSRGEAEALLAVR